MPNTSHGYPYPVDTATPDVPRDVKALADAVNERAGANAAGEVSCTIAIGALNSPGTAVVYPVGRFPSGAQPLPFVTANAGTGGAWATVGGASETGCMVYLQARATIAGAALTRTVYWLAQTV